MSRLTAPDRLRRLLSVVPWVVEQNGASLEDISERFDYPQSRLEQDLIDVVQYVGIAPYSPGDLIEVDIESGWVRISYADYFRRPLQLTVLEGLALVSAGAGLVEAAGGTGDGALASGIAKLAARLGIEIGESVDVTFGSVDEPILAALRQAYDECREVEIDYFSVSSDKRSTRTVQPLVVASRGGSWYLSALDHLSGERRTFRVDRIRAATVTDVVFERDDVAELATFAPADSDPRVRLRLSPLASWLAESVPIESITELDDGSSEVELVVSSVRWLERLLLQLGSHVEVVEADEPIPRDLTRDAAGRLLERYVN